MYAILLVKHLDWDKVSIARKMSVPKLVGVKRKTSYSWGMCDPNHEGDSLELGGKFCNKMITQHHLKPTTHEPCLWLHVTWASWTCLYTALCGTWAYLNKQLELYMRTIMHVCLRARKSEVLPTWLTSRHSHTRAHHMHIRFFQLSKWVEGNLMILECIHNSFNMADHRTKNLGRWLFYRNVDNKMGHIQLHYSPCHTKYTGQHALRCNDEMMTDYIFIIISDNAAAAVQCHVKNMYQVVNISIPNLTEWFIRLP